jgi:hypothetical protein
VALRDDVDVAEWLVRALSPWTERGIVHVGTLVPADYPAHARILHRSSTRDRDVRWGELAARTGRSLSAETAFPELVGWHPDTQHQSPPEPWLSPDSGSLRADECAAAAEVLARHTSTPDACWFCLWEGYGWADLTRIARAAPRVEFEHRSCLLFHGPVASATAFRSPPWFQSPTWWWPEDRAWCVASELDIYSTYVAATTSAIRALVDHPALEVLECTPDQDIEHGPYPTTQPGAGSLGSSC